MTKHGHNYYGIVSYAFPMISLREVFAFQLRRLEKVYSSRASGDRTPCLSERSVVGCRGGSRYVEGQGDHLAT